MRLGIVTRSLPPNLCGIGDHTVQLASSLRDCGHNVVSIAGRGEPGEGRLIVGDDYSAQALEKMGQTIVELNLDHIILQYTPQMYCPEGQFVARALPNVWRTIGELMSTSMIVHETYFRSWRWPPSMLRGTLEKLVLQAMCRVSQHVFTASEPLVAEMSDWGLKRRPVMLPISSNIPKVPIDTKSLRSSHSIAPDTLILTLFGGGNNLKWMLGHIQRLEQRLNAEAVPHAWLLLGGIPRDWLPAEARVVDPGRLSPPNLSAYLQLTDVFVMPNWSGVNAKRGTLIAALEHGLPVVGTSGAMTDSFWSAVKGVDLVTRNDSSTFVDKVLRLAREPELRLRLGCLNTLYFQQNFTRSELGHRICDVLETVPAERER